LVGLAAVVLLLGLFSRGAQHLLAGLGAALPLLPLPLLIARVVRVVRVRVRVHVLGGAVARRERHLVLLLEAAARVREPRGHLVERHLGDYGEHDLLALRRIRILAVLVQPRLQRRRRLACRVLAPRAPNPNPAVATAHGRVTTSANVVTMVANGRVATAIAGHIH